MDCIFCSIVKGEIDSAKIWEDNHVLAFLDVHPDTKGHCLVIPKQHCENIFDIDENLLQKVIVASKKIAEKIKNSLQAEGINLMSNNGKIAGQIVPHFHIHIIPRYAEEDLLFNKTPDMNTLKALARQI
ncbi:MAG: hypothetical protein A3A98_00845 [Candidatus Staskawiczbacteria bacterium RIFCSPLOWO2_01_FULL_40_39]|uniref:HIT domain-containing protein n=1 Tax=Candidatus Staskawiczbacteria bacterium RIFCSPHIGHO2_01_FULL_39_25 TaxID=1802202 RepID=A0A1G2HNG4_9BACT|nr:MAG: hypothetical protein A2730_00845 [Candidatus Staskawiczbacteria bacterium RIFCSPHIGHO2_01_FULL_39_25]OGZ73278.1 MAG: hypothetical protein A3A98_00845 [Candidatus Staskawiczbacteria bacterium RIFCSPLOWO2_01_FULL_40_39]OGZ75086.1 MAG: hypothetical protein A3I87_02730 [Candidatus Staskawiczbacteria bacterium RIFCSPLOWO2_02_FULL_39_8]